MQIPGSITKKILIDAAPTVVWAALTQPTLMRQWMSPDHEIGIVTDWQPGSPFTVCGPWYKTHFENKGVVLVSEPEERLGYSHFSSLSRLPDVPENYTHIVFTLTPGNNRTQLELTLSNFPNDGIYHHINYYWNVALGLLKKFSEQV